MELKNLQKKEIIREIENHDIDVRLDKNNRYILVSEPLEDLELENYEVGKLYSADESGYIYDLNDFYAKTDDLDDEIDNLRLYPRSKRINGGKIVLLTLATVLAISAAALGIKCGYDLVKKKNVIEDAIEENEDENIIIDAAKNQLEVMKAYLLSFGSQLSEVDKKELETLIGKLELAIKYGDVESIERYISEFVDFINNVDLGLAEPTETPAPISKPAAPASTAKPASTAPAATPAPTPTAPIATPEATPTPVATESVALQSAKHLDINGYNSSINTMRNNQANIDSLVAKAENKISAAKKLKTNASSGEKAVVDSYLEIMNTYLLVIKGQQTNLGEDITTCGIYVNELANLKNSLTEKNAEELITKAAKYGPEIINCASNTNYYNTASEYYNMIVEAYDNLVKELNERELTGNVADLAELAAVTKTGKYDHYTINNISYRVYRNDGSVYVENDKTVYEDLDTFLLAYGLYDQYYNKNNNSDKNQNTGPYIDFEFGGIQFYEYENTGKIYVPSTKETFKDLDTFLKAYGLYNDYYNINNNNNNNNNNDNNNNNNNNNNEVESYIDFEFGGIQFYEYENTKKIYVPSTKETFKDLDTFLKAYGLYNDYYNIKTPENPSGPNGDYVDSIYGGIQYHEYADGSVYIPSTGETFNTLDEFLKAYGLYDSYYGIASASDMKIYTDNKVAMVNIGDQWTVLNLSDYAINPSLSEDSSKKL